MGQDIKMFNACDHIVNGQSYDLPLCPRCYGKGYYFDIHFDISGKTVITSESNKLQQEILKIIIDEKYRNLFHPEWGSQAHNLIGSKNANINKSKLEIIIRNALEHLKSVQINQQKQWNNLTDDEIIDQITDIEIINIGPTGYHIKVMLSNKAGEILEQSIQI